MNEALKRYRRVKMNYLKEQPRTSDHLDNEGIMAGDSISVEPLTGKRHDICLMRTCYDFVSKDIPDKTRLFKVLGSQESESFHVKIYQEKTLGRQKVLKLRYRVKVIKGSPILLNGLWVMDAFLEDKDIVEIGFNKLTFCKVRDSIEDIAELNDKFIMESRNIIRSRLPILLEGETGVGKSSMAKKIHKASGRHGEFVQINIASFSETLVESELFGHVKGAFTGAVNDKLGAFKQANNGTLFIDEIDSLNLDVQTKLLLFLDDLKARAVGGAKDYQVNVRLLFSSGRDLKSLVLKGSMRKDFYFRISSGYQLKLDPLRNTPDKICSYCVKFALENNIKISEQLIAFYQSLPWPGNYRQLKGHLERKLILAKTNRVDFDHSDEQLIEQSSELEDIKLQSEILSVNEIKNAYVKKVFYQLNSNYTVASKKLKISARSIREIIKKDH